MYIRRNSSFRPLERKKSMPKHMHLRKCVQNVCSLFKKSLKIGIFFVQTEIKTHFDAELKRNKFRSGRMRAFKAGLTDLPVSS